MCLQQSPCPDPAAGPPLHLFVLSMLLERALRSKVVDLRGAGSPFTAVPPTSEQTEMLGVMPRLSPDTQHKRG